MIFKSRLLPLTLAFLISAISTLFLSLMEARSAALVVCFGITLTASFLLISIALEFLVFREINEIYESFNKIKKKDFKLARRRMATLTASPLQQLNEQIYDYATKKQKEIDQLMELEAFRREFLADVSHELKTPIFAAQGFIHTLIDGAVEDSSVRDKFLQKAARSLDGLDHLVNDLITISQMEAGVIKMKMKEFDLIETVKDVFDQLEDKALEKDVKLLIDERTSRNCLVYADPQRIRQVISNLVENGIKYGNEGGQVVVWLLQMAEECQIEIRDNGPGISKKHLSRIFERFYRVEKSRSKQRGGSGLGLAIVKQILDAHHTEIQITSKVGKGTQFSFRLKRLVKSPNTPVNQQEASYQPIYSK